jgi:hypothetical protein
MAQLSGTAAFGNCHPSPDFEVSNFMAPLVQV